MVKKLRSLQIILMLISIGLYAVPVWAMQSGSIRGVVYDKDFELPLAGAQVLIAETGQTTSTTDEGNYVFGQVESGTYTLVFSKDGYVRQVKSNVVVTEGLMTEVTASLSGEFTEMEEFIVQDVQIGTGTEAALLNLRMESPALISAVSSELMSQAGASDAASALKLVAGATVQEGKYAVVRGLPDRYVNSQLNGIRLPTADIDKRAVQLDQFPASVIESVQVTKTFTPDQQGDASGGAVNVVLKTIPDERVLKVGSSISFNTNVMNSGNKFQVHKGGGLNFLGKDDGGRGIQYEKFDTFGNFSVGTGPWDGSVGTSTGNPPTDYKWSAAFGDKKEFDNGLKIGGFGSFFYERDSSHYERGIDDDYRLVNGRMEPKYSQGHPGGGEGFLTSLFDVTQSSKSVQWGVMGILGLEYEGHELSLLYMHTRSAEDEVTLAEDKRGKIAGRKIWGNLQPNEAPWRRSETIKYTERTTETLQFSGKHTLELPEFKLTKYLTFFEPELDWSISWSKAGMYQPDKIIFNTQWYNGVHHQVKPGNSFTLGNLQRVWKEINEESNQYAMNLKLPFEQWSGDEGYIKIGMFNDSVHREYDQDSFSNFSFWYNPGADKSYKSPWDDRWSWHFNENPDNWVTPAAIDVDYVGDQKITAMYYMMDMPLNSYFKLTGGFRKEITQLSINNFPEEDVFWYPTDTGGRVELNGNEADVSFKQRDILPSIGFEFKPTDKITFRGSYSETVARQTFKELTPIQQQEYLGADIFIGNPSLKMSALKNYDLRFDYTPYEGGLWSVSWFRKRITNPIEYVQKIGSGFDFTKPVNYPKGEIMGWELEMRQKMGNYFENLEGLTLGANATLIDSVVTIPPEEVALLQSVGAVEYKRDMTNAPEHLYNFFLTYNMKKLGLENTDVALFYTIRGDTLVAGSGTSGEYPVPSIYETEYGTLNLSLKHKFWDNWTLKFSAKNLLDPDIETVYRSSYYGHDQVKTSYRKGREFSISLSTRF